MAKRLSLAHLSERNFGGGASFRFRKERHPPRMVYFTRRRPKLVLP